MKHTFLIFSCIALFSCTHTMQHEGTDENGGSSNCYLNVTARDTVFMHLMISGNTVSGHLIYNFYEKDDNVGSFEGTINQDTILAEYKFKSEGVESIRQVAFLNRDSVVIEGYGNSEEKDGKMFFINPKEISFTDGMVLKKISCE